MTPRKLFQRLRQLDDFSRDPELADTQLPEGWLTCDELQVVAGDIVSMTYEAVKPEILPNRDLTPERDNMPEKIIYVVRRSYQHGAVYHAWKTEKGYKWTPGYPDAIPEVYEWSEDEFNEVFEVTTRRPT